MGGFQLSQGEEARRALLNNILMLLIMMIPRRYLLPWSTGPKNYMASLKFLKTECPEYSGCLLHLMDILKVLK